MTKKMKSQKEIIYNVEDTPDDFDFELPSFSSPEEAQSWLDSLPHEDAEVDERLTKRITITMNLHQLMVDGYDYLAKLKGIGSGKNLMYMVLNQYLNENLPDEF
ncbi:hypothetical protein H8E77_34225 [bacterium]|nr:hypothetical protein [bacterium]